MSVTNDLDDHETARIQTLLQSDLMTAGRIYEEFSAGHVTDYCQQTVEVHGRPHTCARLNDHSGKHQVAVPQVGLVKW